MASIKTVYICAWLEVVDGIPMATYQQSDVERFREESIISAGVQRGKTRVRVYSDHVHGVDRLKEDELRLVAVTHLDYLEKQSKKY